MRRKAASATIARQMKIYEMMSMAIWMAVWVAVWVTMVVQEYDQNHH